MEELFRKKLLAALELELPYPERLKLPGGRPAAVLLLIGHSRQPGDELSLLITRRTDSVGSHKGQMAFPGGTSDPGEIGSVAGTIATALRETEEEVGIPVELVEVLGTLPPLTTITDFDVTPVVGHLKTPIEDTPLKLSSDEIAEALWVPLAELLGPETYRAEFKRVGEVNYPIHVYQVGGHRVWGATGSMIKNLLDRLGTLG